LKFFAVVCAILSLSSIGAGLAISIILYLHDQRDNWSRSTRRY
jgi:hypothetical protein